MADTLGAILRGLMERYQAHVPEVGAILQLLVRSNLVADAGDVENDHIAFRTLGIPNLGIASLQKIFLHHGYERRDRYHFPAKKVDAFWYAPPDDHLPRIFISELRVGLLSPEARGIIHSYTDVVTEDPVEDLDLDDATAVADFLHAPLWRTPTWSDYVRLLSESEFAAWVIYNRYYLNHFTIAVHGLPAPHDTLARFNEFLERHGFTLNDAGGKIKTSADGKLLQSSTVAALVEAEFDNGKGGTERHSIAGSYVEFAERRVLDQFAHLPTDRVRREHRREGFETASADKIFESTYTTQTRKRPVDR